MLYISKSLTTTLILILLIYIPFHPLQQGVINLSITHSRLLCLSNYFFNRVINDWNQLPATIIKATLY